MWPKLIAVLFLILSPFGFVSLYTYVLPKTEGFAFATFMSSLITFVFLILYIFSEKE